MTTVNQQMKMFYDEGRKVLRKKFSDFVDKRHKERYKMVEEWRKNGMKEEEWKVIEEYDKDTDRQEKILEEMLEDEWSTIKKTK